MGEELNEFVYLLYFQEAIEDSLQTIHDIATENLGALCLTKLYRPLKIALNPERYTGARQKADLAAVVLQDVGVSRHNGKCFRKPANRHHA